MLFLVLRQGITGILFNLSGLIQLGVFNWLDYVTDIGPVAVNLNSYERRAIKVHPVH